MITNRTLKRAAAAVGLGTALALLAGCAPSGATSDITSSIAATDDSTGPVTISFWDNNGGPGRTPIYEELIKRFEAQHPNITVNYVGIPAAQAQQKYETAVAGGSVPDVGVINSTGGLSGLVAQGALLPLDDLLTKSDLNGKIADDAIAGSRGSSPDGKLYVMPATSNTDVIWYNSAEFKAAGVSAPASWSDFFSDAVKLTDKAAGKYGFALRGGGGGTGQFMADIVSCGGVSAFFDKDGNSLLNTPEVVDCVKKFAGLYNVATSQADLNYAYPETISAFDSGSAAMVRHNLGSATAHVKALGDGVAVSVPLPANDSGKRTLLASSTDGPAIFTGSKNKNAAWVFVQFLMSHESNSYWNEQVGQIPNNTEARTDAWVAAAPQVSSAIAALSDKDTTVTSAPSYLPDYGSITTDLAPEFQAMLLGQTSADTYVKDLSDKLTAANQDFLKSTGK